MSKAKGGEQTINKKSREALYGNKNTSKNIKAMMIIVSIILVMVAGVSEKFFYKGTTSNVPASVVKTIFQTTSEKSPVTGVMSSEGSVRKSTGTIGN